MSELRERGLRVAAARADFLEFGPAGAAGVDELVAASWQRSQSAGVDADAYHVDYHDDIDFDSQLARCAAPVIERLARDMIDVPVTIALTDARARIVERRDCSSAVGRVLDRVDFQRGFSFEENGCGTNGVGTVFEVGAPVTVLGYEHFNQALIPFACTGAPIFDPLTGRVAGVLDASMLTETWNPLVDALIRSAADDIGRNLLLDHGQAKRALFETYLRADLRPRQAVMAVGAGVHGPQGVDTVMVNERARELLTPEQQDSVAQFAHFLMYKQDRAGRRMTLDDGRRIRLRTRSISCNGDPVGVVILLDEDPEPAPAAPVPRTSPTWQSALDEAIRACEGGSPMLIVGEPGSGRVSLAAAAFRELHADAPVIVVDAERLDQGGRAGVSAPTGPALLVIRHIDKVSTATVDRLCALADEARADGCLLAATIEPPSGGRPAYAPLLSRLDLTVTVPPLRVRGRDLEAIVARIVQDVAPGGSSRVSPAAMRRLGAYAWPGNIRQLQEALQEALRRRPVGEIQESDLPGFCRTTSTRTLTPLEAGERDAIVAALAACDGNRVRAAAALGLSRSSLYRKLHTYAISGL